MVEQPASRQRSLELAFRLCAEALDVLDATGVSPEIAAHLDLAIQEIRRALAETSEGKAPD
jgi:hypothetical protein